MPLAIKSIDNLAPGMRVARDVDVRGMVLLKAGTLLNDQNIQQLRKWAITNIGILEGEEASGSNPAGMVASDDQYIQEKARIEQLFATVADDKQMQFLMTCFLKHLEGH
ncbi:MAG: hypothetical protein V2A34_04590 [Lentisphaerota bacterium]